MSNRKTPKKPAPPAPDPKPIKFNPPSQDDGPQLIECIASKIAEEETPREARKTRLLELLRQAKEKEKK